MRILDFLKTAIDPRLCPDLSTFRRVERREEIKTIYKHLLDAAKVSIQRRDTLFIVPYKFNRWFICTDGPVYEITDEGFSGHRDTLGAALRLLRMKTRGTIHWKLVIADYFSEQEQITHSKFKS